MIIDGIMVIQKTVHAETRPNPRNYLYWSNGRAEYRVPTLYCTIVEKLTIESCPILVLITVLGRPRHTDSKNDVKNYQGPTTSGENAIQKYFQHTFF